MKDTDINKRIIYKNGDGVSVLIPASNCELTLEEIIAKDMPSNALHKVVDVSEVPSDRTFRLAWEYEE